jgi:hypothetical protein
LYFELVKDAAAFVPPSHVLSDWRYWYMISENFHIANLWTVSGLVVAVVTLWLLMTMFAAFMKEDLQLWDQSIILKGIS